ncbi:MAG TPA: diaminopimelate epimerase [Pyrinomonadaceae bacterium]|jgi:diaminopimelate epimerase
MPIHFTKFHGLGNDYLVIEPKDLNEIDDLNEFARRICSRHYGAGGDGIAVVSKSETETADFRVRIFNPDGSEAALSGNGTRCAAAYLYFKRLWSGHQLRLNTRSGLKRYFLKQKLGRGKYVFESELGQPKFDTRSIPMSIKPPLQKVVDYPLEVNGDAFPITALQMGNPNCCIFVNDFNDLDWRRVGSLIENHELFPDRTNVVFARVHDRKTLELRIWERGVGETTASGSCSCAAAVAAMVNERVERKVTVVMPGGEVKIEWRDDGEVVIVGTAEVVYSGQWLA